MDVQALPVDILAEIFDFAPFVARLRTLSFVCKRWRVAALRSVHHAYFEHRDADEPHRVASAVALFPTLRSVTLDDVECTSLPTTLRELTLTISGEDPDAASFHSPPPGSPSGPDDIGVDTDEVEEDWEPPSSPPMLTCHFPHLTALDLTAVSGSDDLSYHITAFVARHSRTLEELTIDTIFQKQFANVDLHFPHLRKLALHSVYSAASPLIQVIQRAPKLTHLSVNLQATGWLDLPSTSLTALVHLGFGDWLPRKLTPEEWALLVSLPRLATIDHAVLPPSHAHMAYKATLKDQPWSVLASSPRIQELRINCDFPGEVPHIPLPHLKVVNFHPTLTTECALAWALRLLTLYTRLDVMVFPLHISSDTVVAQLCAAAAESGLATLQLMRPSSVTFATPQVARSGWVRLELHDQP